MCGRIKQASDLDDYMATLRWNPRSLLDDEGLKYNVPPGTRPLVFHRLGDGEEQADRLFWGYKPPWFKRPPVSNARIDKILAGASFWRVPIQRRVIVPADGWYEWTGEKGDKQPWYISAKDGHPILMAAVSNFQPGAEMGPEHGFAIVTDDSAGGMVDIHDRRPIALTPDDALEWLDPATTTEHAKEILSAPRPESAFQWWQVTRAMGNSRYQMPDAAEPIS